VKDEQNADPESVRLVWYFGNRNDDRPVFGNFAYCSSGRSHGKIFRQRRERGREAYLLYYYISTAASDHRESLRKPNVRLDEVLPSLAWIACSKP
jgi:hypothetical protein